MKTFLVKGNDVKRDWFVVDATGKTLGRLASLIAFRLRGKHKPVFAPFMDLGDFIVVVNAAKVALTGRKMEDKSYYRHSGYPGHLKTFPAKDMLKRNPIEVLRRAVWGMLPKGPLGRKQIKKLKIYAGAKHPHEAQTPQVLEV